MKKPFLVCAHDATPAYAQATRVLIRELAPLLERRFSFAVVPDWCGAWPLWAHPEYCRLLRDHAEELLLHGYYHRRGRGRGPTSLLVQGSDEMNGLDPEETQRMLERGQRVFSAVFGEPARGFVAPAWRPGHVRVANARALGLEHVLGFFSLSSAAGRKIPLATWTWHCGRWRWLGHVGHVIGWTVQSYDHGVPTLAIHPTDLELGFWPKVVRLIRELLEAGYEPCTPTALLRTRDVEVAA